MIAFMKPEHSENENGTNSPVPLPFRVKKRHIASYGRQMQNVSIISVPFHSFFRPDEDALALKTVCQRKIKL